MVRSHSCLQIPLLEILLVHWEKRRQNHFLHLGSQRQRLHQVRYYQILRLQILRQLSLHQLGQHWLSHQGNHSLESRLG